MSDFNELTQVALAELVDAAEEIEAIESMLEHEHPEDWQRLQELKTRRGALGENAKTELRRSGSSGKFLGHFFKVQKKTKTEIELEEILEVAKERGELDDLIDQGFLRFIVKPDQLDRLSGASRAIYGEFITVSKGTSAVTLPKALK